MYSTFLGVSATAVVITLSACSGSHFTTDSSTVWETLPDGTHRTTHHNYSTNTTITVTGTSKREIIRKIHNPRLNDMAIDYQIQYRYEYSFNVYDIHGNLADTVAVGSLDDALELLPAFFELGGMSIPSAETIGELETLISSNWVEPALHWAIYN